MATCEFSEFSFGYALTDSLASHVLLGEAPVFPSLFEEGSAGGGYDLNLPAFPFPVFLQFKIQQVMVKDSSKRPPGYPTPYYRMPLRTKAPNQHALMRALEVAHPMAVVAYATPLFHSVAALDSHFLSKQVHASSDYFAPSWIGRLDTKPHHISYRPGEPTYWLHSEPKPLQRDSSFEHFAERIRRRAKGDSQRQELRSRSSEEYQRLVLDESVAALNRANSKRRGSVAATEMLGRVREASSLRSQFKRLAYVCQVHFGLTLMLVES